MLRASRLCLKHFASLRKTNCGLTEPSVAPNLNPPDPLNYLADRVRRLQTITEEACREQIAKLA